MKQIKIFLTAAMLAVGATVSAQFTNATSKGSNGTVNTDGWGTFYLQWNPSTLKVDVKDADDLSLVITKHSACQKVRRCFLKQVQHCSIRSILRIMIMNMTMKALLKRPISSLQKYRSV